jgi:hypothetical protein
MPSNAQKLPMLLSLNQAMGRSTDNRAQQFGKCLPCSVVKVEGAIVTVKFEVKSDPITLPQAKMPLFGPEYIRYPIQEGDKGFAISADAYLGQMSGLGTGTADLATQPNLSTLAFMPCGNKDWREVDKDQVVIYGPNGVLLEDAQEGCKLTLTPDGIVIDLGSKPLTINAQNITLDNAGNLVVTGDVTWGATPTHATTHTHTGVQAGTAVSGPPVPGS